MDFKITLSELLQLLISLAALTVGICTVWAHGRYTKKSKTAEMLLSLNENNYLFESIIMIHEIHHNGGRLEEFASRYNVKTPEAKSIRYVLNHFERVGACVANGIYDKNLIRLTQGSRIIKLFDITKPYIDSVKAETNSESAYSNLEYLKKCMEN